MAFRLLIFMGARVLRRPLRPGQSVLGSDGSCDLVVRHPTVSRRHAELNVTDTRVTVSDLGSSNGTRVDDHLVSEPTVVETGMQLRFGSIRTELEEVGAGDIEAGVGFAAVPPPEKDRGWDGEHPISTVGPAVLELFALKRLPGLVEALARGDSRDELVHLVGEALLSTMPCHRVEIAQGGPAGMGILFSGERAAGTTAVPVTAEAGDGLVIRVGFLSSRLAGFYEPLVRATAGMIRVAARRVASNPSRTLPRSAPPSPPAPPSVVPAVRALYQQAARIAQSRVSVLVRGESGTGKELLARYIHAASDRAGAPLVTLNCAALPRDLLESELFGVERGVATGVEARPGKFEAAHGGTLFLDEIGDMAPETQAKILRVLEEGEVYRLGGQSTRPTDVRVISATNRDVDAMLAAGEFRSDLYHRVADWVVEVPPLRQRRADIPNLAAHFLARACAERGVSASGISRSAVDVLQAYDWPGNVRQLEKEMGRAALFLEEGELLDTARLQTAIVNAGARQTGDALATVLEHAERAHIARIVHECDGVVAAAAERLEMGVSTLYRRMKALGIES